jgi:hypothetical protein
MRVANVPMVAANVLMEAASAQTEDTCLTMKAASVVMEAASAKIEAACLTMKAASVPMEDDSVQYYLRRLRLVHQKIRPAYNEGG